jgi:thiol-disulfide isomerase/thioredoxin
MSEKLIIAEMDVDDLKTLQSKLGNGLLIIKFGADWCGPCKKIAPTFQAFIKTAPPNIIFADINVDDNVNLFIAFKKYKMIQGIPVFLAFYGNSEREHWFIPDDSCVGADEKQVADFFTRCQNKALAQAIMPSGYTYFS